MLGQAQIVHLSTFHVNHDLVECQALDFVYGGGPGEYKGECDLVASTVLFFPILNVASCLVMGTASG